MPVGTAIWTGGVGAFDTPNDIKAWVLSFSDMLASGDDFDNEVESAIILAWHDFHNRFPFWWSLKYPPGAFVTVDDITSLTLTIAAAGASVAGTLSATYASTLQYYKIQPSGKNWIARITAHTAGSAALTLDAVPETIAAGTACTIFQDELQLASDLGLFVDGLWRQDGHFVELWPLERLVAEYPDPPSGGDSPVAFARLDKLRIRLSHYPTAVRRYEYPYSQVFAEPSGSDDLAIDQNFRWVLAHGALYFALLLKSDKRAGLFQKEYERGIEEAIKYHRRVMGGLGVRQGGRVPGAYA